MRPAASAWGFRGAFARESWATDTYSRRASSWLPTSSGFAQTLSRVSIRGRMATVTFDHVTKAYADGTVAVNELDLLIKDGEFLVLVGPSGCGKTTALRCLAGLEEITAGQIKIDARVVNRVPPKDRNIAMVFQSYALYP